MADELVFLPLGGCREIGMNLNAYGFGPAAERRWLIVDVGVTFADARMPGIDLIMADPSYVQDSTIAGIVLTHAHEDHIGAIGHLWPFLRAPIHASAFTAHLVAGKLDECDITDHPPLRVITAGQSVDIGPFRIRFVPLTHSIPEMSALHIATPLGRIFHTGDWKIDPEPLIGSPVDEAALRALGDEGVDVMVCDSTNVFVEGEAGSEASVRTALIEAVARQTGKVALASFASNVARMSSACEAAQQAGRAVVLVGRSMHKISEAAKAVGLLKGISFLDMEAAQTVPGSDVLYLCTGSQGEERAALARIARGDHPHVRLDHGDCVIFSSRVIPGNERPIAEIQNALAERGVAIITEMMEPVHVSGHPCRDELRRMYQWIRPTTLVPVHGERRHCLEHCRFAERSGISRAIAPDNGEMLRLAPGPVASIDQVPSGRMILDGSLLTPVASAGLRERRKLAIGGHVVVSLAIGQSSRIIDGPVVTARGLSEPDGSEADDSLDMLVAAAEKALSRLRRSDLESDDAIDRALKRAVRRASEQVFGKRPVIDSIVLRV